MTNCYLVNVLRTIANDATDGQAGELAAIEIVYICHDALTSRAPVMILPMVSVSTPLVPVTRLLVALLNSPSAPAAI